MTAARLRGALFALAAVTALLLCGAAILLAVNDWRPVALERPSELTSVPLTHRAFDDARTVDVTLEVGDAVTLRSNTGGRVTASTCAAESVVASGQSTFEVDGFALVNLATTVPLWRDLVHGDAGKDVAALQEQLAALGFNAEGNGIVGPLTMQAVTDLLSQQGNRDMTGGTIPSAAFVWLPSPSATVSRCHTAVGDPLAANEALATLTAPPTAARVTLPPQALGEAARELVFGDTVVPVDETGVSTDAAALLRLTESPAYREWLSEAFGASPAGQSRESPPAPSIQGSLRLREPIEVAVVPPGAIFEATNDRACVSLGTSVYPVQILGSELGQTFLHFPEGAPEAVNPNPIATLPCPSISPG